MFQYFLTTAQHHRSDTCADSVDFSPYDTVTTLLKVGTLPAKVTLETHSDMSEILMDEVELLDGDINTIRDYLSRK